MSLVQGPCHDYWKSFNIYNDSESSGSNPSKDALCERNTDLEIWCLKVEFTGLPTIRTV